MLDSRIWCASALLCVAACSFPNYQTPPSGNAAAALCNDGIQDGDEVGVDCGGSCKTCRGCHDSLKNGDETGVDCGGSCMACPSCDDELQNGSESDVDCGGTCAKRCEPEQRCRERADCASLSCTVVCQAANCLDEVRNGQETGKDCGGGCPGCANGNACHANSDCQDGRCQNDVCVSAGCTDGLVNGFETDRDCGGRECAPCQPSGNCKVNEDCDSRLCMLGGVCSAATCIDLTQNQGESAADCGGPSCPPCATGKSCSVTKDCESSLCQSGTCVPQNPAGQPFRRANWVMTTSESQTETGLDAPFDDNVATSWASGQGQDNQMWIEVDLGQQEIFFKALLRVTEAPYDQDFPGALDVFVSSDGTFGAPSRSVDGNQWTWIDLGSAQVGRYVRFELTKANPHWWSIGEFTLYN